MTKSMVRYEAVASDPTVVWRIVSATNYKADVGQHQLGNFQKQVNGLQESMNRVEVLLHRLVNSQARTLDQTVGRGVSHLRPPEEPRDLPVRVPPAELENEKTISVEDLWQISLNGTQGIQSMSTPEGNFNSPSTGFSVVATGWDQDPLPHAFIASPTLNNLNPSHGPEMAKDMEKGVCKYCRGKWFLGHQCKYYQQMNLMAGVSEEVVPKQGERFNHPITISYPFTHNLPKDIMPADLSSFINMKLEPMEQTVVEAKSCTGDGHNVDRKLRQKLEMTEDEAHFHMKQGAVLYNLKAQTLPKSYHCYFIRLMLEYFKSSSLDSYEKSVSDFSYLVKRLVSVAMDRHDKEKEMVSVLLSSVYSAVVKVKMNGKFQDDTVFLKKWHDEEPFEFKTDEEEVIDGLDCAVFVSGGTKRVVRIWDPGTGSKNLKWPSSPLGVVGGLTFGAASAAGKAQPEDLFLTLKVESALYSAGAAESFCTARREDMAVAMCLMLAAKLLYAEGNLISHAISEKAAEVFEDPGLVGIPQMDSTTAWSNNRIQVRDFSVGQAQEAEPLFHGAFEGPVNGLASDSMRIYSYSWDMTVCIWGRAQMKLVQKFMHADWVWSLAPHGNTVACTAGRDAYLWDMGSSELTNIISNAYVGNAYSLARTHLPDVLFTRREDGAIRLFSVYDVFDDEDINPAATWVHHTSPVHSLAFEYPWLVSASCDGRISLMELWKFLTPKSSSKHQFKVESCGPSAIDLPQRMLHGFGCSFFSIDIGADGIVCVDENGGVKVWNFSEALVYTITNEDRRPYRLFCSIIGSIKDDIPMLEEPDENIYLNIRHTKDFQFIMSNAFSDTHSKTVVEPPGPKGWKNVFFEEPGVILEEVDFCDTHLVLIWRQGRKLRFCSANLPLLENITVPAHLSDFLLFDLPLSNQVCQILSSPNYDSTMRFTISSLVMPDAVVDYNLLNGKWQIVQQQNMLHEGTKVLYGNASVASTDRLPSNS